MKFEVDASIPSPVVFDVENDIYSHVGNGERRVSNLQIIDSETGDYSPVDLGCTYTLASVNYLLVNWGDSESYVVPNLMINIGLPTLRL